MTEQSILAVVMVVIAHILGCVSNCIGVLLFTSIAHCNTEILTIIKTLTILHNTSPAHDESKEHGWETIIFHI